MCYGWITGPEAEIRLGGRAHVNALIAAGRLVNHSTEPGEQEFFEREVEDIWRGVGNPAGQVSLQALAQVLTLAMEAQTWLPGVQQSLPIRTALYALAKELRAEDTRYAGIQVADPFPRYCLDFDSTRDHSPYVALRKLYDAHCHLRQVNPASLALLVVDATSRAYKDYANSPLSGCEKGCAARLCRMIACGWLLREATVVTREGFIREVTGQYPREIAPDPMRSRQSDAHIFQDAVRLFDLAASLDGVAPPKTLLDAVRVLFP